MPYTMQMASNGVAVQLRRGQWRGALTNLDATIANGKTIRGAQRRQLQPFVRPLPVLQALLPDATIVNAVAP